MLKTKALRNFVAQAPQYPSSITSTNIDCTEVTDCLPEEKSSEELWLSNVILINL
jgi:hypothetical protein